MASLFPSPDDDTADMPELCEINVTPFIDVMLVLAQRGATVLAPQADFVWFTPVVAPATASAK